MSPERAGELERGLATWRALVEKGLRGGDLGSLTTSTLDSPALAPLYTELDRPAGEGIPFAPRARQAIGRVIESAPDLEEERRGGATLAWVGALAGDAAIPAGLELVIVEEIDAARAAHPAIRTLGDPWSARIAKGEPLEAGDVAMVAEAIARGATALGANGSIWSDAGAIAIEEIAWTLASFVESLRALEQRGLALERITESATITLSIGQDLFLEIAKLRAMRRVIARVLDACGVTVRPVLAARSGRRMIAGIDRDTNLVRTTLAASAGLIGGADAIAIAPHGGEPPELAARLARNVPLVLTLEAHLGAPIDPARGSHYVEALTADLARRAWALFREIEASGGMARAAGSIRERLAASSERRCAAFSSRRAPIVGVSKFPPPPGAPAAVGGAGATRDAAGFEALRASATGLRAEVLILPGCPDARAALAREIGAVAGLVVAVLRDAAVSGATAPLVVIAADDAALASTVPDLVRALRRAPSVRAIAVLARPGLGEAELRAAGVDALVDASSNLIATLAALITRARGSTAP